MNETIVVEDGQAAVATTAVSGTLSPASSATDTIAVVDTPSGKQAAVVTTSVSGTLSPASSATDTIAIVDTPSGKQAALKVYNLNGGGGGGGGATINNQDITVTKNGTYTANEGYTGLGTVEVQVPNPSTGTLSIVENGSYNVTEYATAEVNVPTGGGATTKFGASVDTWVGEVDENGVLQTTTWTGALNFAGVKEIGSNGLYYGFYSCPGITSVDLSSITTVNSSGLYYGFCSCTGITSVDLSSLTTVNQNGLYYGFYSCPGITSVDLSSLTTVEDRGLSNMFGSCGNLASVNLTSLQSVGSSGMSNMFGGCANLASVDLTSLQSVGSSGMSSTFGSCRNLTSISFPSLTDVQANSFGPSTYNYTFYNCAGMLEIHFRADMQATIEAVTGYSSKFGATNCTIYFDLIGTITVAGVAYSRNEPNSIRVNGTKTFVAWKDASNNIVYTNATAEPAVDTPVYSDAGTTQVGTVSGVA